MKKPINILQIADKLGFTMLDLDDTDLILFSKKEIKRLLRRASKYAEELTKSISIAE